MKTTMFAMLPIKKQMEVQAMAQYIKRCETVNAKDKKSRAK